MAREALAYGDNLSAVIRTAKETIWHTPNVSNSLVHISIAAKTSKHVFRSSVRFNAAEYVYENINAFSKSLGRARRKYVYLTDQDILNSIMSNLYENRALQTLYTQYAVRFIARLTRCSQEIWDLYWCSYVFLRYYASETAGSKRRALGSVYTDENKAIA